MVELQELITRGRFIFSGAPGRFEIFKSVDGVKSTKEIARISRRSLSSILHDVEKLVDLDLVNEKKGHDGKAIKKGGAIVFEKNPVIKHVPLSYFQDIADTTKLIRKPVSGRPSGTRPRTMHIPADSEILDVCRQGEDQIHEFKAPGIDMDKLTKEITGFLHTKGGGTIFYGVDDDGTIIGSNVTRQDLDQRIQNSVRNTVSPPPTIEVHERSPMGTKVLLIAIPPWNRKTIYQNTKDNRYYIRRGTNIFALKPDEIKTLSRGDYLV